MEEKYRTEQDRLGSAEIPENALYGIHALRAKNNFPDTERFSKEWYKAVGTVKLACYNAIEKLRKTSEKNFGAEIPLKIPEFKVITSLKKAASEVASGDYFGSFIVPAVQGGAGTSINMNINEIIANRALIHEGEKPGTYSVIDPVEHANLYQSTNDVIPTALHTASMLLMLKLENEINLLRHEIEKFESEYRNSLRIAYTQMQQAVPSSLGRLFSTYNEALSRDWWRVSRAQERLKVVNLGGSAVGSGITSPRFFIMEAVKELQKLTSLPVTRSENMHDATCNLDPFVEVHGFLKAHAVTLEKTVSDLRLLSSDLLQQNEIRIPQKQVGSSIMPGKVNPVIPEFVISAAHRVYANDQIISSLASQGMLDLNAYLPLIGHSFLNSIELLIAADKTLKENLFSGLVINIKTAEEKLFSSPAVCTALLPFIGYHNAEKLTDEMNRNNCNVFKANEKLQLIDGKKLEDILSPSNLLKEGFSLYDLTDC